MEQEIQQLKSRIEDLERWKSEKERKQITFPLDEESIEILNNYFVRIVDRVLITYIGASAHYFPVLLAKQGGETFDFSPTFIRYTADPSTDVITIVDQIQANRFGEDTQVAFYVDELTGGTSPAGITLAGVITYYVVNASSDGYSFQISESEGGSALDFGTAGVGKQFITRL